MPRKKPHVIHLEVQPNQPWWAAVVHRCEAGCWHVAINMGDGGKWAPSPPFQTMPEAYDALATLVQQIGNAARGNAKPKVPMHTPN